MDPYLESRWPGVHVTLITLIIEALQPKLPRDLRARGEERILLENSEDVNDSPTYRGDIAVVDLGRSPARATPSETAAAATIEPVRIQYLPESEIDRFIQIIDVADGYRVITAIEILSPTNKRPGRLNKDYRRKLADYERGQVNVVEIDFLRTPTRDYLPVTLADIPLTRRAPYLICVKESRRPSEWLAYPISLRTPLPEIPIPLRPQDAPVPLALQPLIERAYVIGGHDDIDYAKPPKPPLEGDDAAWAESLLKGIAKS